MNATASVACCVLTIVALLAAAIQQPTNARCMPGTALMTGIRRDGSFACWAPGRATSVYRNGWKDTDEEPAFPVVESRIYCTNGTEPVVRADGITVGCQPRGGR